MIKNKDSLIVVLIPIVCIIFLMSLFSLIIYMDPLVGFIAGIAVCLLLALYLLLLLFTFKEPNYEYTEKKKQRKKEIALEINK